MFVRIVRGDDINPAAWYNKAIDDVFEVCRSICSPNQYILIQDMTEPRTFGRYIPKNLCEVVELEVDNDARIKDLEYELEEKNVALAREVETNALLSNNLAEIESFKKDLEHEVKERDKELRELYAVCRERLEEIEKFKEDRVEFLQQKMQESERMDRDAAIRERLGAINYIAASTLYQQDRTDCAVPTSFDGPRQLTIDVLKRSCNDCFHCGLGHTACLTCDPCRSNWEG